MKNKTVYVLGAGFSAGVKNHLGIRIPSQEKLVEEIFKHRVHFEAPADRFEKFLIDTMGIPHDFHYAIPLEDIFTPLDKCIAEGISFRDLKTEEAKEIRELVYFLIGNTMRIILENVQKDYVDVFANYLVEKSSVRANWKYNEQDPVSVITTNWDILLDNSIKTRIENGYRDKAVVDYCCQISSFDRYDKTVKPGLEILGKGGFNVKLLKLHGSLNWLQCPRCFRIYVMFFEKIAVSQHDHRERCRHCRDNFGDFDSHTLTSNLIMPTFLKNLSNAQYKIIWQNAGIELAEANKVVFIGYSLPPADFEMKQLLSRMVRSNAEIEVVDIGAGPDDNKILEIKKRYEVFFGRMVKIHYKGSQEYIENHLV